MKTYDCPPTLNDSQVLEFCKNGFLLLPGVVNEATNQRTLAYLAQHPSSQVGAGGEPVDILREAWFLDAVICNPQAAGAVRSLLGKNFALPNLMANHRNITPSPAQGWHRDGGSQFTDDRHHRHPPIVGAACSRMGRQTVRLLRSCGLFAPPIFHPR